MLRRLLLAMFLVTTLVLNDQTRVLGLIKDTVFCEQNPVLYSCVDECSSTGAVQARSVSTSGGCGNDKANDQQNKDQIWGFLVGKFTGAGYSKEEAEVAASGVMGNWWQESTFNSHLTDVGMGCNNSPAYGIAQWCFGRIDNLKSFANDHNADPTCLGTQLDFMWSEMEGEKKGLVPLMKGVTPREAAHIFNLGKNGVGGFEVGADDDKRQGYADDIYKEYTGKTVAPTQSLGSSGTDSGSSGGSGTTDCPSSGAATDGAIPSEECQAVLKEYDELVASGKITTQDKWHTDNIDKDVKNCTTEQIECGTGDGKGGVHPRILRAVTAAAKNSGANTLTTWNFNTGHDCDGLNHPRGMAVDIYCIGNKGTAKGGSTRTATEDCNLLFKYFYDHYEELGLTELIWTYPPPEFSCSDPKIMCYVAGHTDHIHVGTRVQ